MAKVRQRHNETSKQVKNERTINQSSKQTRKWARKDGTWQGKGRKKEDRRGGKEGAKPRKDTNRKWQWHGKNCPRNRLRSWLLVCAWELPLDIFFGDVNVGPPLFVSCRTNDSTRGDAFKAPQICMSNKWIVGSGRRHPGNHAEAINIHKVERRNYALNPLSRILSLPLLANPCLPIPSQGPELWWSKKLACPYLWPPFPWLPLQTQTKTALCPWPSVNAQCKWTLFGRRKWTCDRFLALLDSHWLRQQLPAFMPSEAEPPALEPLLPRSSLMQ